ncbi:linear gramicidin dehydrogenase LgrE [Kordia sp. SMS9]|uniref:thioesterase II family protein n=1 Tax=Kordia sp. SMS9 TaxID=2282170 RepID=UPI000E0DD1F8|nr:alpha/beta fold hydrolase [Kordia sp. SMS9]AXG72408.1 linear gramicidin dehydrogenase LgrE [Kordia sp. SMS9]
MKQIENKIKLFCLPFAGGAANMYDQWNTKLAKHIEVCPIHLAGRGNRFTEKPYSNLEEAVNDIFDIVKDDLSESDYAIFGHSMGALLAYELVQKIRKHGRNAPVHVFFSGRKPVHIPKTENFYRDMTALEFQEAVLSLGVTPPEIFKNPELKAIFGPLLLSDFTIAETFVDRPEILPLSCNITALIGQDEEITKEEGAQWKFHTTEQCAVHYMEGGHFFLLDNPQAVIDIINDNLCIEKFAVKY